MSCHPATTPHHPQHSNLIAQAFCFIPDSPFIFTTNTHFTMLLNSLFRSRSRIVLITRTSNALSIHTRFRSSTSASSSMVLDVINTIATTPPVTSNTVSVRDSSASGTSATLMMNKDATRKTPLASTTKGLTTTPSPLPTPPPASDSTANNSTPTSQYNIASYDLHESTIKALQRINVNELFPVQHEIIRNAMVSKDLIVRSRTGSGKTLGFAIPILDFLNRGGSSKKSQMKVDDINALPTRHGNSRGPRVLILTPTRELTIQIRKVFFDLLGTPDFVTRTSAYNARHSSFNRRAVDSKSPAPKSGQAAEALKCVAVYGGSPMSSQIYSLQSGVDIVIGTPGRLIDLFNRGALRLDTVEQVVLDEADTMLDIGFIDDIRNILSYIGSKEARRTMLFSATLPREIQSLIDDMLRPNPVRINTVEEGGVRLPAEVDVFATPAIPPCRDDVLAGLLNYFIGGGNGKVGRNQVARSLVFTQTQASCNHLAESDILRDLLNPAVRHAALHGGMTQSSRERTMNMFRSGRINTIIATDVAARGLDIPDVDLVVHYDLATSPEKFIHRTGRTARAGKSGSCAMIFDPKNSNEKRTLSAFAKEANVQFQSFPIRTVPVGKQDSSSYSFSALTGQPGLSTMKVFAVDGGRRVQSDDIASALLGTGLVKESGYRVQMAPKQNSQGRKQTMNPPQAEANDADAEKGEFVGYIDVQLAVAQDLEKREDVDGFVFARVDNLHKMAIEQPNEEVGNRNRGNTGGYRGGRGRPQFGGDRQSGGRGGSDQRRQSRPYQQHSRFDGR